MPFYTPELVAYTRSGWHALLPPLFVDSPIEPMIRSRVMRGAGQNTGARLFLGDLIRQEERRSRKDYGKNLLFLLDLVQVVR